MKNRPRSALPLQLLTGLFILFFLLTDASGRDVQFDWTANSDNPAVDGYRLFYKTGNPGLLLSDYSGTDVSGGNSSPVVIPGQSTISYTLSNLSDAEQYSFVLTAYRGADESSPTSPVILGAITSSSLNLSANLTADNFRGQSPLSVAFDATASTGDITEYLWTFGDGATGNGSLVSHTFETPGSYTVVLKVTDTAGAASQTSFSINVTGATETNNPPVAVISSSSTVGQKPLSVSFDGSSSTDSDGDTLFCSWRFGDGGSATGAKVNHVYSISGMFNAKLTVADGGGLTDSNTTPVIVSEPASSNSTPPTAVITASAGKGFNPLTISFSAGESFDPDGEVAGYAWNFGDGTISGGRNVIHTFLQPAVFTVTLKVIDDKGTQSKPATFTVRVLDRDKQEGSLDSASGSVAPPITAILYLLLDSSGDGKTTKE